MSTQNYITQPSPEEESSDSDHQQQLVRNILNRLLPAKEIVDDRYAPDPPIQLKLLSIENNLASRQRKALQRCVGVDMRRIFSEQDTLHHYFQDRPNDLLYLKFDNQGCSTHVNGGREIRYLAGYFQPVDAFDDPQSTREPYRSIYDKDPSLKAKGFKKDIRNSFGQNTLTTEEGVRFSSNFESANLFAVFRKLPYEYELVLQNDINSRGNTQWFYFAVEFTQRATYRFNIINFTKSDSLYNCGMKIATFSYRDFEVNRHGWNRSGTRVAYKSSGINREGTSLPYYTLSFDYTPVHDHDIVLFAHCYPYTFTDLDSFLQKKISKKRQLKLVKLQIGKSLSGLPIYALRMGDTIKPFQGASSTPNLLRHAPKRKSLVFMARQHSGQTPGSFVMEGIIESLVDSHDFDQLKKQFVLHIIPMINPDGAYYGNYRTNLSGHDLNRRWRNPSRSLHPQIYCVRKYLSEVNRANPISLIIDLHGHSRKINSFFYGNPSSEGDYTGNTKIFPLLCSKVNRRISYQQSTFFVSEDKRNTARVVLQQLFPQAQVFTFEASFYGFRREKSYQTTVHEFTVESYKRIGRDLLQGYLDYLDISTRNQYETRNCLLREILAVSKNSTVEDGGSDSEPEQDSPDANPASIQQEFRRESEKQVPRVMRLRSSRRLRLQDRQPRQEKAKMSVEISTQTQNLRSEADNLQRNSANQEGCLSILRIFPMKTSAIPEPMKLSVPVGPHRRSLEDSLKTVRKCLNNQDEGRNGSYAGFLFKEETAVGNSHLKQKMLSIKNIPTLSNTLVKEAKQVERTVWNHKSMIIRYS